MKLKRTLTMASYVLAQMFLIGSTYGLTDPIEGYLSSAEEKTNNIVNNAGAQARGMAMETGQMALIAIAAFRAAYNQSLDQTDGMLSGQQEELFRNIKITIDRLDAYTQDATINLRDVTENLATSVANIPLSKDIPRVTHVSPLYILDGESRILVFRGIGLSNSDPVLETPTGALTPLNEGDTELKFQLPAMSAKSNGEPGSFSATLRLFERKNKFLFFSTYIPHTYPVNVSVYPREIGEIKITPRRKITSSDTREITTPGYRCQSPQGQGSNHVPVNVVSMSPWAIDVPSIRYVRTYSNHGSFTMGTTSPSGFTATLSCNGWGRVVVGGVIIDRGSIGVEQGYFTYTEFKPSYSLQNGDAQTKIVRWGDSLTLTDLPSDTETVLVEFKPFTGQLLSSEGEERNRFMEIKFNRETRVVMLKVNEIEKALRQ